MHTDLICISLVLSPSVRFASRWCYHQRDNPDYELSGWKQLQPEAKGMKSFQVECRSVG